MPSEIDQRVVEMQFDNAQFEKNVATSMSTLDKLKNALNFQGLKNTADAIDGVSESLGTSGLSSAVDQVGLKFSALEVMAVTALANITNSAMNAGAQLLKSFTVDPIMAGWNKFAEMTLSKATLAAQGYDAEEIEEVMAHMATYTDETSYHISEITAAMGKFTATGVDLQHAAELSMGLSNMVALSGQNAAVADRLYIQLAQAMSTGSMRAIDYKSFQTANVATKELQQSFIDVGVAMGTIKDLGDGMYKAGNQLFNATTNFDDSLKSNWLNTEVMTKTFENYNVAFQDVYDYMDSHGGSFSEAIEAIGEAYEKAGNEAGLFSIKAILAAQQARTFEDFTGSIAEAVSTQWSKIFTAIFGETDQAIKLWTGLSNSLWEVFAGPLDRVNSVLSVWSEWGGTDSIIDGILAVAEAMEAVSIAVMDGLWFFSDEEETADRLLTISKAFRDFAKSLIPTEKRSEQIKRTFAGLSAIFDLIGFAIRNIVFIFSRELNPEMNSLGDAVWDTTASIGDFLVNLNQTLKESPEFLRILAGIGKTFAGIVTVISDLIGYFTNFTEIIKTFRENGSGISGVLGIMNGGVETLVESIKKLVTKLTGKEFPEFWSRVERATNWVKTNVIPTLERWQSAFNENVVQPIKKWIDDGGLVRFLGRVKDLGLKIFNYIKEKAPGVLSGLIEDLKDIVDWINNKIPEGKFQWLHDLLTKFSDALGGLHKKFDPVSEGIEEITEAAEDAASKPWIERLTEFISNLWEKLKEIGPKIEEKAQPIIDWAKGIAEKVDWGKLIIAGGALAIFWKAFNFNFDRRGHQAWDLVQGFTDAADSFSGFFDEMGKVANSTAALNFALAIGIISKSLLDLASVDIDKLRSVVTMLGILMAELALIINGFSKSMTNVDSEGTSSVISGKGHEIMTVGFAILEIAGAIWIISDAAQRLAGLDQNKVITSVTIIAGIIAELAWSVTQISKNASENDIAQAGGIILSIAVAVDLIALAITAVTKAVSGDPESARKAVNSILGIILELGLIAAAITKLSDSEDIEDGAISAAGGVILALAVAVDLIAVAITALTRVYALNPAAAGFATASVAALIFALGAMAATLIYMSDEAKTGPILASVAPILAIAVAIDAMAVAIGVLTLIFAKDLDSAQSATRVVIALTGALMVAAIGIMGISKVANPAALLTAANSILAIAAAVDIMAIGVGALALIANMVSGEALWASFGVLALLLAEATAAIMLLAAAGPASVIGATALLTVSAAMVLMATSVVIFIDALSKLPPLLEEFSNMSWETVTSGALKIAAAVAILSAGLALLVLGAAGLLAFSAALIVFSGALILISAVITIVAAGFLGLATAIAAIAALDSLVISKFIENLGQMFVKLGEVIPIIISLIGQTIEGICQMLIQVTPRIFTTLGFVLDRLWEFIQAQTPKLFQTLGVWFNNLWPFLNEQTPKFFEWLGVLFTSFFAFIQGQIPNLFIVIRTFLDNLMVFLEEAVPDLVDSLFIIIENVLDVIDQHLPDLVEKLVGILFTFVESVINVLCDKIPELVDTLLKGIINLMNGLAEAIRANTQGLIDAYNNVVLAIVEAIVAAFKNNGYLLKEIAERIFGEDFVEGIENKFEDFKTKAREAIGKFIEGVKEKATAIWNAARDFVTNFIDGIKNFLGISSPSKEMSSLGEYSGDGFIEGIGNKIEEAVKKAGEFVEKILGKIGEFGENFATGAKTLFGRFTSWLKGDEAKREAEAAGSTVGSNAVNGLNNGTSTAESTGSNFVSGFIKGINDNVTRATTAARNMGSSTIGALNRSTGVASPSKFTRQTAIFFGQGFIDGLAKISGKMESAAEEAGADSYSALNDTLSQALDDNINAQPVIRPILDLTDIQNGASVLQSLLSGVSGVSLGQELANAANAASAQSGVGEDLRAVVTELKKTVDELISNPRTEINNQFDIHGETDPGVIADAVANKIQQQVELKESTWA